MKIRIIGSMSFYEDMIKIKKELQRLGHKVFTPIKFHNPNELEHVKKAIQIFGKELEQSDAILVVNKNKGKIMNYIGMGVAVEIGMALGKKKKIYMLNPPIGEIAEYYQALKYITIDEDLRRIK